MQSFFIKPLQYSDYMSLLSLRIQGVQNSGAKADLASSANGEQLCCFIGCISTVLLALLLSQMLRNYLFLLLALKKTHTLFDVYGFW